MRQTRFLVDVLNRTTELCAADECLLKNDAGGCGNYTPRWYFELMVLYTQADVQCDKLAQVQWVVELIGCGA